MAAELSRTKYQIIVVNGERTQRKTYMTHATIEEALYKANTFGCQGEVLLNDKNGSELCDDEILEYLLERKTIFMVCKSCSDWKPRKDSVGNQDKNDEIIIQPKIKPKNMATIERFPFVASKCQCESPRTCHCSRLYAKWERCPCYEFENFTIPWSKVPADIMNLLEKDQLLLKKIYALAQIFVDEMLKVKQKIPQYVFQRLAERTVYRYPHSFFYSTGVGTLPEIINDFYMVLKNRYSNVLFGNKNAVKVSRMKRKRRINSNSDHNYDLYVSPRCDNDVDDTFNSVIISEIDDTDNNLKIEYDEYATSYD